jgi:hypothetical protein
MYMDVLILAGYLRHSIIDITLMEWFPDEQFKVVKFYMGLY